jgi:hypothetical protein
MASLQEFLDTGRLGEIAVGASNDFVRQLLGEPNDVSTQRNPELWKYGAVQLGFYRGKGTKQHTLAFIGLYFQGGDARIPDALKWTGWFPYQATTSQVFQGWPTQTGVTFSTIAEAEGETADYLVTKAGVAVTFADGNLQSIQYAAHHKSDRRQLSVSIPPDVWDRIREEAAQQKVSMAELCSRWITDHIRESTGAAAS